MRNYDLRYKSWIKQIFSRDKFTCQWPNCNKKNKLNAHHIQKWSDFPGLRFHLNNGITLCKYHHDYIRNMEENYAPFFLNLLLKKQQDSTDDS